MRLLPLLLLSGCIGSLCRGPGCEDVWPAGQVLVMNPFEAAVAREATAAFDLSGTVDHGAQWSLSVLNDDVYVGMPEVQRIVRWSPEEDPASVEQLENWPGNLRELGAVVIAGDPDGNGLATLMASAPGAELDAGAVVVWEAARQGIRAGLSDRILEGASPSDRLGEAMVYCPDLTGDGVNDLIVAAPHFTGGSVPERGGRVFLVPSEFEQRGILSFTSWAAEVPSWHGEEEGAAAGSALACGEDLTGDGVPDVVIGAPGHGTARQGGIWILDGANLPASGGLGTPTREGSSDSAWLGSSLAVGDLDGDGIGDLAVGAAGAARGQGEVAVHYGPDMVVPRTVIEPQSADEPTHLGRSLLFADLDGDGLDELIVGAEDRVDGDDFDAGWVGVWRGSTTRLGANLVLGEDEDWSLQPDHAFQRLGSAMVFHEGGLVLATRSRGF
ncbi:MAG: hypothetical protein EP330_16945 [Deltaproteobacteria bacterium]|nr:MAG: hypothetical protein EP330_16945 [Deltaproteobacteria bacterium]